MAIITYATARTRTVFATRGDTLFAVAARELGSALQWTRIAKLNGLDDPWLQGDIDLRLPPIDRQSPADGVLGL